MLDIIHSRCYLLCSKICLVKTRCLQSLKFKARQASPPLASQIGYIEPRKRVFTALLSNCSLKWNGIPQLDSSKKWNGFFLNCQIISSPWKKMRPPAEEILRLGRKSRKKLTVKFLQIFAKKISRCRYFIVFLTSSKTNSTWFKHFAGCGLFFEPQLSQITSCIGSRQGSRG